MKSIKSLIKRDAREAQGAWISLALTLLVYQIGLSQFQNRFSMPEGLLLTAPREVEVLLSDAQEAIDRKQWAEVSIALGQLLGDRRKRGRCKPRRRLLSLPCRSDQGWCQDGFGPSQSDA